MQNKDTVGRNLEYDKQQRCTVSLQSVLPGLRALHEAEGQG